MVFAADHTKLVYSQAGSANWSLLILQSPGTALFLFMFAIMVFVEDHTDLFYNQAGFSQMEPDFLTLLFLSIFSNGICRGPRLR